MNFRVSSLGRSRREATRARPLDTSNLQRVSKFWPPSHSEVRMGQSMPYAPKSGRLLITKESASFRDREPIDTERRLRKSTRHVILARLPSKSIPVLEGWKLFLPSEKSCNLMESRSEGIVALLKASLSTTNSRISSATCERERVRRLDMVSVRVSTKVSLPMWKSSSMVAATA